MTTAKRRRFSVPAGFIVCCAALGAGGVLSNPLMGQTVPPPVASPAQAAPVDTATRVPAAGRDSVERRIRTLDQLGFTRGLILEGVYGERQISFQLPAPAPIENARLGIRVRFPRELLRESSLEVLANDVRLAVVTRADSGSTTGISLRLDIPPELLRRDFLVITFRSAVATNPDLCLDQRLGRGRVEVAAESYFSYDLPVSAITTIRAAWAALPETVTVALPERALSAAEFRLAHELALLVTRRGHVVRYTQLPALGDLTIAQRAEIEGADSLAIPPDSVGQIALFRHVRDGLPHVGIALMPGAESGALSMLTPTWLPVANLSSVDVVRAVPRWRSVAENPTFAELGIGNLERRIVDEADWHIPLDLRDMPPGRLPSAVTLDLVTAPNTRGRELVLFAFLNGTLVKSADIDADGEPQQIRIPLPSSLLATRNDLRLLVERQVSTPGGRCGQSVPGLPAHVLPTSRVHTAPADAGARVFMSVTTALRDSSQLFIPIVALEQPADYLPLVNSIGDALWTESRIPRFAFYADSVPAPVAAFVVIGSPAGALITGPVTADSGRLQIRQRDTPEIILDIREIEQLTIAQVVSWNGQVGVQFHVAPWAKTVPSAPESYDRSDLMIAFGDSTLHRLETGRSGDELVVNTGPGWRGKLDRDRWLWLSLAALLVIGGIAWGINFVRKRTPRKVLRRPFARSAREERPPE